MQSWRGWLNTAGLGRRAGREASGPLGDDRPADQDDHGGTSGPGSGPNGVADSHAAATQVRHGGGDPNGVQQHRLAAERSATTGAGAADLAARGAAAGEAGRGAAAPERGRVPSWLQTGAAWSWRLLLIVIVLYVVARAIGVLYIVVVPCVVALLLTALLQPLSGRLQRAGLPNLAATWCTLLIAAAVLGGIAMLITVRVRAEYPTLVTETKHTVTQIESLISGPPFHITNSTIKNFLNNIPSYLSKHKALVEGTLVTGGKIAVEFFTGLVLTLFVTFFLIKDGERIWNWLIGKLQPPTAHRWDRAGRAAWTSVVYYMRGTVVVAAIHAVVVGLALWIMGAPLVIPLAVIVFLASFVPLVGLLLAGALAILVTLAAKGWVAAVILLTVLIVEDQLEAHLLQPQVVGRVVRLHPLAVILAIAVGTVVAGIPGAVVAVPIVAVITRALPELRRRNPYDATDSPDSPDQGPDGP
jgi:predicted PurR-regulated permease PerM